MVTKPQMGLERRIGLRAPGAKGMVTSELHLWALGVWPESGPAGTGGMIHTPQRPQDPTL